MEFDRLPDSYRQNFEGLKYFVKLGSKRGLKRQSPQFIQSFAESYLRCVTSVTQLRSNKQWYSEARAGQSLLARATIILYPEQEQSWKRIWHGIWVMFPAQLWKLRYCHLVSFAIVAICTLLGFILVRHNFEMANMFIPSGLRSSHDLDAYIFSTQAQHQMLVSGRNYSVVEKSIFAQYLMFNNISVAARCYFTGFLFGLPTLLILVQTGLMLGALPALFYGGDFVGILAWLLPHGVPEVSSIILAGGAGLNIGLTMLSFRDQTMGWVFKRIILNTIGTLFISAVLLVWAGLVESFVRQSTLDNPTRLMIAALSLIPLFLLFLRGYFASRIKLHPGV